MKKKKKNSDRITMAFGILLTLTSVLVIIFLLRTDGDRPKPVTTAESKKSVITTTESSVKTYKATLIATGDALIHSPIYKAAYDPSTGSYDFNYMLTDIKDEIRGYDIKYYNQEVVFDDDKPYSSYPMFNVPSAWGKNMTRDMGFNLVSLATNHSMDCGNESAKKYAQWWESQENVLATGMASTEQKRNEHVIAEANGITYTMLSYTYGTNGIPVPEDYVVNVFDEEKALRDIRAVRDKVDVLIVAMHWGAEYNTGITDAQKEQAKFLGANGADIILGTHSHCLEPWEWIDEDTVVFYSFGNFISNQMSAETPFIRKVGPIGMLGSLEITKTVDAETNTSEISIDHIGAEILYSYKYYNNAKGMYDYSVIPFSKMDEKYLNNYEDVFTEFSSILKKYDDRITISDITSKEQF